MTLDARLVVRLQFLCRVIWQECHYLQDTDNRLFQTPLDHEALQKINADPVLAERLDAFVARFARLQDSLGDKLLPALLTATGEAHGPALDNLDKAEKFYWITSADQWMAMRRLRNQMVHEHIEDPAVLISALTSAHEFVGELTATANRFAAIAARFIT